MVARCHEPYFLLRELRQLGDIDRDAPRLIAREQIVCGRALGRRSNRQPLPLRSQTRFSFFNDRYAPPAALPITAPFFFESETAGLMFVPHRWPQSFRWWLFCRFSREDAAADYECAHDCPENPKWHLLHCGVLRRPTPLRAIIRRSAYQVLRNGSGSFAANPLHGRARLARLAFALIASTHQSSARFTSCTGTPALTARLTMSFVPPAPGNATTRSGLPSSSIR